MKISIKEVEFSDRELIVMVIIFLVAGVMIGSSKRNSI